jgi:hypothetical protein
MIKVVAAFVALGFLAGATGRADASKKDHPNYGYCPNGKKVSDINKCNRDPDGSCKPGRQCKSK